jgi:hypothetical protein
VNERDRQFADATRVVDDSIIMRLIVRVVAAIERVFVGRAFQARRLATAALKGPLYVLLVVVACATHALLLRLMPDRIAPVKPLAYGMVLAFAAFATIAGFITTRSNATATADNRAGTANTMKS